MDTFNFRSNFNMGSISTSRDNQVKIAMGQMENRSERTLATSKTSIDAKPSADNRSNRYEFKTGSEFNNQRKRSIIEPVDSAEPPRKKNQENYAKKEDHAPRCLTGNVGQVLDLNKAFPGLNAFYEVFGKVVKVIGRRDDSRKIVLMRNTDNSGSVMQAIFYEVDVKMVPLQTGDEVRCVGKFASSDSRLTIFKISPCAMQPPYVLRLNSIGTFLLKNSRK